MNSKPEWCSLWKHSAPPPTEFRRRASKRWWCSHPTERRLFRYIQQKNYRSRTGIREQEHKKHKRRKKLMLVLAPLVLLVFLFSSPSILGGIQMNRNLLAATVIGC